jgi:hypothetical protein
MLPQTQRVFKEYIKKTSKEGVGRMETRLKAFVRLRSFLCVLEGSI